ncbi:hypothetical protein E1B28_004377 [Marasmius oreades]|uniref:C2H2-type domain-containing protein n=1 Tax=Marasmius oreades TaxID=181124 RepID=A0A9P7UYI6_9AGAR|nr:uncharacterized protein E1B28_004377 [Marasmius oreades]KAG7096982.1 hypothetical protein E1B28_004377 [Marasmius oreades]
MHSSRCSNRSSASDDQEAPAMERLRRVVKTHSNISDGESIFRSSFPPSTSDLSRSVSLGVFRAPTATYTWPPLASNDLKSVGTPRLVSGPTSSQTSYQDPKISGPVQSYREPLSRTPGQGRWGTPITLNSPSEEHKIPTTASTSSSDGDESGELWTQYATMLKTPNATSVEWVCMWTGPGYLHPCYYQGKKQLVKRHVETKHMMIKRFVCEFCDKQFAQKTSLNVHISSKHLKNEPHKCEYHGCIARYNDPARLCRHKIEAHGYVPRSTSRKKDRSPHPAAVELYNRGRE